MISIRDAFNQIGRKRFAGAWTGEEISLLDNWPSTAGLALFSAGERAAFDRCAAIIVQLQTELEAGRAVVMTTGAHHELHDVSASYWRDSAYEGRWRDGGENLADYLTDRGTSHYVRFAGAKTTVVGTGVGRPNKYAKEVLLKKFVAHCELVGAPSQDNEKGWQTQADVQRWLAMQIKDLEGVQPDEKDGTLKRYARAFFTMGQK